jgi:cytochrome c-type biogenesis protein CcmF
MFAELGVLALIASLCFAVSLVLIPSLGLMKGNVTWMSTARYYVLMQWGFAAIAFCCLDLAFLLDDFRLTYVQMNSSVSLPWFYKLCALWGGHEGSMLLWVCILQTWTLAAAFGSKRLSLEMRTRILVVLGVLSICFLSFILTTSNPFIMVFKVLNTVGRDLNPLLQDPGFLFHPPMLYVGYVGFSIAFAVAIALLWAGEYDEATIRWSRPWVLAAWSALTLGIMLGSWWAYRELGWGGFWFWDPVENASFMPWLVGTALIHSLLVAQSRKALVAWVILLSILVFSLSLIGTFLVRSGVLTSVHAFAVDPQRGLYILCMLFLTVGGSLLLFAVRAKKVISDKPIAIQSREMMLLLNNVFLVVGMLTVLLGTIYPLLIDGLGLGKLSVGAPYFNTVFVPLMMPLLLLMGLGIHFAWGQDKLSRVWKQTRYIFILTLLVFSCVAVLSPKQWTTALGIALSVWVCLSTFQYLIKKACVVGWQHLSGATLGMCLAHLGIGVCALGIAVSSGFGEQQDEVMQPGEKIQFAGFNFLFKGETSLHGPNYHGIRGMFEIQRGNHVIQIYPEKRIYEVGGVPMTDAAVDVNPWRDIYVALGEPVGDKGWGVRLYYKPMVRWIWLGGALMFLGGIVALLDKRRLGKKYVSV